MGRLLYPLTMALALGAASPAWAQKVPRRQIPPAVLAELAQLQSDFDLALATDCHPELCFPRDCVYVDHAVIDRPRATSLPGLGGVPGPGSVEPQEFLTRASCSFAHEPTIEPEDAQILVRRLQSKVSGGFVVVSVAHQLLEEAPQSLRDPDALHADDEVPEVEPVEPVEPPPEVWSASVALRELWTTLLPHTAWMIGIVMVTLAGTMLVWAFRRVGKDSLEDQLLLAQMANGDLGSTDGEEPEGDTDGAYFAAEQARWGHRLAHIDEVDPDHELQALVREPLRSGDRALLAKAILTFPSLTAAFPDGGELAEAKLDLADYLKRVDPAELPSDADFYRTLSQHALSAAVAAQDDARIMRSLREDFGAAGLAALVSRLPARQGALLYALAPSDEQHEMLRLLRAEEIRALAERLLRSNRMHPKESSHLFEVLHAVRQDHTLPPPPPEPAVSDRGARFDAAGAVSVLLSALDLRTRRQLFRDALQRFGGSIPSWYRRILVADMLFELPNESLADVLLGVDAEALAAWLKLLDANTQGKVAGVLPRAAAASISAVTVFPSRERQLALAGQGRRALASAFYGQLERQGRSLEQVFVPPTPGVSPTADVEDTES